MTIRDRLIEALMDESPRWDHIRAGEVLDAMLVVLADNADEWIREAVVNDWDNDEAYESMVWAMAKRERRLLAVLEAPE